MSRLPRQLGHPYTYYSPKIGKVVDNAGVVHETQTAEALAYGYARRTRCTNLGWYLLEPLTSVCDTTTTTCLECVGAVDDG